MYTRFQPKSNFKFLLTIWSDMQAFLLTIGLPLKITILGLQEYWDYWDYLTFF